MDFTAGVLANINYQWQLCAGVQWKEICTFSNFFSPWIAAWDLPRNGVLETSLLCGVLGASWLVCCHFFRPPVGVKSQSLFPVQTFATTVTLLKQNPCLRRALGLWTTCFQKGNRKTKKNYSKKRENSFPFCLLWKLATKSRDVNPPAAATCV